MGQALYRTHRPKSLDEVVGQEHVTKTLQQALDQNRISHAYLFTGPRGVGKTSIARIWAHEINKLPYEDDSMHLDIIEIDAASNRRIDEIRELRDKVYIAPTSAAYKVYIIDEVHMLTKEAFNALLKTLEEPPAHAVFILATTDAHKLPDTIISRTQRYSFKPVPLTKVVDHLRTIAQAEGITAGDDALELLAEHGEGSFRDSISMLDQASSNGKDIALSDVQQLLGVPSSDAMNNLLEAILSGVSSAELMTQVTALYDQGFPAAAIAKRLGQTIRAGIITDTIADAETALELLKKLLDVPSAHAPDRLLEICLLQALPASPKVSAPQPAKAAVVAPAPVKAPEPLPEPPNEVVEAELPPEIVAEITFESQETEASIPEVPKELTAFDTDVWPAILAALKQKYNTLYGVIRMAQPEFTGDNLKLTFRFAFHQKRVNEAASRKILSDIVEGLTGQTITIECLVDVKVKPATTSPAKPGDKKADISAISNIFGSAEVLES